MKKWGLKIFQICLLLAVAFVFILLHYLLPKLIVDTKATQIFTLEKQLLDSNTRYIDFQSFDHTKLEGLYGKTTQKSKGTMILLHGIRGYKEHFIPLAQQLQDSGYNTLALDLRAHGSSGGEYCTYGYYEKKDIKSAVDFLLRQPRADSNLGVWGQSLGGAIALQSLAYDERLKFGVVESTFSDLETIVQDYSERMFGFSIPWVNEYALSRASDLAHFDPEQVSPRSSAKRITQPMLITHGTADKHIRFEYGKANFDNLSSQHKVFLPIPGAVHHNVWTIGGKEYQNQIFQFLYSLH